MNRVGRVLHLPGAQTSAADAAGPRTPGRVRFDADRIARRGRRNRKETTV